MAATKISARDGSRLGQQVQQPNNSCAEPEEGLDGQKPLKGPLLGAPHASELLVQPSLVAAGSNPAGQPAELYGEARAGGFACPLAQVGLDVADGHPVRSERQPYQERDGNNDGEHCAKCYG